MSIGDDLRADAVAYWTMNEASGTRYDSTGHGNDLSEYLAVPQVSGKVGQAAKLSDSTDDAPDLEKAHFDMDISNGFTFACWIWISPLTESQTISVIQCKPIQSIELYLEETSGFYALYDGSGGNVGGVLTAEQWHFAVFYKTAPDSARSYIQVDNGEVTYDDNSKSLNNPNGFLILNQVFYVSDTDYYYLDEVGLWPRVLTQDERDYLWNSGAGRALFDTDLSISVNPDVSTYRAKGVRIYP